MTRTRPEYELTRVFDDGEHEAPEIVPVTSLPWDAQMGRRGCLGAGLTTAAAMLLVDTASAQGRRRGTTGSAASAPTPIQAPEPARLAHTEAINVLAVAPDGNTLASASADSSIKLWSLPEGKLLGVLNGHTAGVVALAFTPDGRRLVSGSLDKTVRIWALAERRLVATLEGATSAVNLLAITPDGATLAAGTDDGSIELWSLPEGLRRQLGSKDNHGVSSLIIAPDGRLLVSGYANGTIQLWSLPDGRSLGVLTGHHQRVECLAVAPDGRTLASGSMDSTARLWSLPEGRALAPLTGHNSAVHCDHARRRNVDYRLPRPFAALMVHARRPNSGRSSPQLQPGASSGPDGRREDTGRRRWRQDGPLLVRG